MSHNAITKPEAEVQGGPLYLSGCRPGHVVTPECEVFLEGEYTNFDNNARRPSKNENLTDDKTVMTTTPETEMDSRPTFQSSNSLSPECEVFESEEAYLGIDPSAHDYDRKNFIPVKEFTSKHLPDEMRTHTIMDYITNAINRTVSIRVSHTSRNRPDTYPDGETPYPYSDYKKAHWTDRYGTGSIVDGAEAVSPSSTLVIGKCPCHECRRPDAKTPRDKYWKYLVRTRGHIVFDESEAMQTVVECFDDDEEDKADVVVLYGVRNKSVQLQSEERMKMEGVDSCGVSVSNESGKPQEQKQNQIDNSDDVSCYNLICVTHDKNSAEKINSRIGKRLSNSSPNDIDDVKTMASMQDKFIVSYFRDGNKMIRLEDAKKT